MVLSSFEKTNLKSKNVRRFLWLILGILCAYVFGCSLFVAIRMIGESYPETWDSLVTWVSGMRFEFSLDEAWPLFYYSIVCLVLSIMFGVLFWLLRWQLLRTILLATGLLSLAYLFCAILLIFMQPDGTHALMLGFLAVLFGMTFIAFSNILIYLRDKRTYLDAALESVVAIVFLYYISNMVWMALRGGTS